MKGTNIYKRIQSALSQHGAVLRIENVSGASVPDIAWLTSGTTIWIECKIRLGNLIRFNKFQLAIARRALEFLPSWQWLCAVQHLEQVSIYRFDQFLDRTQGSPSSRIVSAKISEIEPWCRLSELHSLIMTQVHTWHAIPAVKDLLKSMDNRDVDT